MQRTKKILFGIHLFVGIGALGGGLAAIIDPLEPLGMPVELLEASPFLNYLIPGLILFIVIGLGHIFSALSVIMKMKYQGYISSIFSWALIIFIVVQCIMINTIHFLHVIYFMIGLTGAVMAMCLLNEDWLFPMNLFHGKKSQYR